MSLSDVDRRLIAEVHDVLTRPDSPSNYKTLIQRVNDLSEETTKGAIEKGRALDLLCRNGKLELTKRGLKEAGLHVPIKRAKAYIELATHERGCAEAPSYRDRRRYGTQDGEQVVIDQIRKLHMEGNSFSSIVRTLNTNGLPSRRGKWDHTTVGLVIRHAEQSKERKPCTCRMFRTDWVKPRDWRVCIQPLRQLTHRAFELMRMAAAGGINYDTTSKDIETFKRSLVYQPPPELPLPARERPRLDIRFLNQVVYGDCMELIALLPDNSVDLFIFSPPYAMQRGGKYPGIPVGEYPRRMLELMTLIRPKLKAKGSVFIVIRAHVVKGQLSR